MAQPKLAPLHEINTLSDDHEFDAQLQHWDRAYHLYRERLEADMARPILVPRAE